MIAAGSADNSIGIWNASTGQLLTLLNGHSHHVRSVAWSSNSSFIASASSDGTVIIWGLDGR